MKILQQFFIIALLLMVTPFVKAQNFEPSGKPSIRVFTNFHSSITDGETHNAFEIQRAYLGYGHQFSETLSGKIYLDVGNPGVGKLNMTAYLKNAYLQYKKGRITAKLGMIGLYQFKLQENLWGGRYLYKSFLDEYKFGPSADLGAFLSYKVTDWASVDITVANGEGYKLVENDSILKYSFGVSLNPVKGLDLRVSYDNMGHQDAQQTIALYAGYTINKLEVGAEYNKQLNHKMKAENDLYGYSFYSAYSFKKFRVFGRYDQLSSLEMTPGTDPWHLGNDGQAIIAGFEFAPAKGINITPNYQGWVPADGGSIINIAYLSCEIRF